MRLHAPLFFCVTLFFFACAHAESGKEPEDLLNSPRCVTDVECGADQKCIKDQDRPDGICAPKTALERDTTPAAGTRSPEKTCKSTKECPGSPCSKKMKGSATTCVFCDTTDHVCRKMGVVK